MQVLLRSIVIYFICSFTKISYPVLFLNLKIELSVFAMSQSPFRQNFCKVTLALMCNLLFFVIPTVSLVSRNFLRSALVDTISSRHALHAVTVHDDVIDTTTCKTMDNQLQLGDLGHTVFFRGDPPRTFTESVIHSLLLSTKDKSPIVEYWWREEWINLELHRDIDERLALQNGPIRFPDHAHVLYLSVGEEALGPTVLLENAISDITKEAFDSITIVPAVAGRFLRFSGDMMHAVPRPSLAYLDPEEGGSNRELWTRRRPVDKNDPELTVLRRSVLLFNTWTDIPPSEISLLPPTSVLAAEKELREVETRPGLCHPFENWKNVYSASGSDSMITRCEGNDVPRIRLKIGLLGDKRRRERSDRYLNLYASSSIKDALISDDRLPLSFPLSTTP